MGIIEPPNRFVGLHCHSGFSVNDGLGYPDRHIDFVLQNGMDAWALTDHGSGNGLAHAHTYSKKMKGKGRKYRQLYGVEFYFVPSLLDWEKKRAAHFEAKRLEKEGDLPEKTDILAEEEVTGGLIVEDEEELDMNDLRIADNYHETIPSPEMEVSRIFLPGPEGNYKEMAWTGTLAEIIGDTDLSDKIRMVVAFDN